MEQPRGTRAPSITPEPPLRLANQYIHEAKNYLMKRHDKQARPELSRLPKLPMLPASKSPHPTRLPGSGQSTGIGSRNSSVPRYPGYGLESAQEQLHVFKRPTPKIESSILLPDSPKAGGVIQISKGIRQGGAPSPISIKKPSGKARVAKHLEPLKSKPILPSTIASIENRLHNMRGSVGTESPHQKEQSNSIKQKRSSMPIPSKEEVLEGDNSVVESANQVLEILS